jgi:hypothetical protein
MKAWIVWKAEAVAGILPATAEVYVRSAVASGVLSRAQLWDERAGMLLELPAALAEPPLFDGGQGRTAEDVRGGAFVLACIALAFISTVLALAWRLVSP